ncbi:MAG: hypothetical protein ABID04_01760 [Patescibacteria group bacterium]
MTEDAGEQVFPSEPCGSDNAETELQRALKESTCCRNQVVVVDCSEFPQPTEELFKHEETVLESVAKLEVSLGIKVDVHRLALVFTPSNSHLGLPAEGAAIVDIDTGSDDPHLQAMIAINRGLQIALGSDDLSTQKRIAHETTHVALRTWCLRENVNLDDPSLSLFSESLAVLFEHFGQEVDLESDAMVGHAMSAIPDTFPRVLGAEVTDFFLPAFWSYLITMSGDEKLPFDMFRQVARRVGGPAPDSQQVVDEIDYGNRDTRALSEQLIRHLRATVIELSSSPLSVNDATQASNTVLQRDHEVPETTIVAIRDWLQGQHGLDLDVEWAQWRDQVVLMAEFSST